MFLILIRDIIKDLQTLKGDILFNYKTLPALYGEEKTKTLIKGGIISSSIDSVKKLFTILKTKNNVGRISYRMLVF